MRPLHASAGAEDTQATIKALLDHRAKLELKDDRGKKAADIAREMGRAQEERVLEGR